MKSAISSCFERLRAEGRCALMPFLTAGDPNLATTRAALLALQEAGADLVELGIPYSDPLADGPVIQAAAGRALAAGTTLAGVLELLSSLKGELKLPVVLFTYSNPLLNCGMESFCQQAAAAGAAGLLVPDLPLEEAERLSPIAAAAGLDLVLLVAPTTPPQRMARIVAASRGFTYLVSVTGVTGVRSQVATRVEDLLAQLRAVTDKPIGVGFGISEPEQAAQIKAWGADAAIVGSAFVKRLAQGTPEEGLRAIADFCFKLKQALQNS